MAIDGKLPIRLDITLDIVNVTLGALSKEPYEKVAQIITIMQQQAGAQIDAATAASLPKVEAPKNEPMDQPSEPSHEPA